jgi:hypothetical protein
MAHQHMASSDDEHRHAVPCIALMMQARSMLSVDNEVVVSVNQHDCGDPGCCGTRTVILVMRPDQLTDSEQCTPQTRCSHNMTGPAAMKPYCTVTTSMTLWPDVASSAWRSFR